MSSFALAHAATDGSLLTNSRLLYGVQSRADVDMLSPERRTALLRSVQSASILVHMAVGDTAYREYFLSANSLTREWPSSSVALAGLGLRMWLALWLEAGSCHPEQTCPHTRSVCQDERGLQEDERGRRTAQRS